MVSRFHTLTNQRAIIDRRALADQLAELDAGDTGGLRSAATPILKQALADGRAEIARRLAEKPYQGTETATAYAFLVDQLLRLVHDFTLTRLYPRPNPTESERLLLLAVGGYGRGEMAPYSDVDIAFVTPWKLTPWTEQVIEAMLYQLWDLGLKVGHASRSVDEMIRIAQQDQTVRTAILEARYIWGDEPLYDEVRSRYWKDVAAGRGAGYVAEKLTERKERHIRMGDSRYVVEPNVKEGKGGLRDLHTLFWIGKFIHRLQSVEGLVDVGLFSADELRQFQKAERFFWAVRCHLHIIAGRAEDRLTFNFQREVAERMNYADRPGKSPVERFMQHYFLQAKLVGDLTSVFLTHLDEQFVRRAPRFGLPALRRKVRNLDGFVLDRGKLALPSDDFFKKDPVRLIDMFAVADKHQVEIHPMAMRAASRDAKLIDSAVRADPRANALFLAVLTSPRDPETVLRWMNEAGVFGRFIPDFGRVVAQMQWDMYHHYTVDEHSIRAIGLLARIERGDLKQDHPLSTILFRRIESRRVLYTAVLLHDIAKGRGGDHSLLGEEIAYGLCPRLGLTDAETESVAWLVRNHLIMSAIAFKRDLSDPKTIADFAAQVKSLERLHLLLMLTVVDIRAVGPGVWNSWKRQLLTQLFEGTEELLRLGHKQTGRQERVVAIKEQLAELLGWKSSRFETHAARLSDGYWLAEPIDVLEQNARFIDGIEREQVEGPIWIGVQEERGATLLTVYATDQPGLFYRLAGAISLVGGNIIDARIHTTVDGMALDNFLIQTASGQLFADRHQLRRLEQSVIDAIAGTEPPLERLEAKALPLPRAEAFAIQPAVFVDNEASNRYTVVEVNARDRAALLSALAQAIYQSDANIRSAHVATYGERAVDVFYVTDFDGGKIVEQKKLDVLRKRLLEAAGDPKTKLRAA